MRYNHNVNQFTADNGRRKAQFPVEVMDFFNAKNSVPFCGAEIFYSGAEALTEVTNGERENIREPQS